MDNYNENRLVSTLTIKEFIELNNGLKKKNNSQENTALNQDIIYLKDAARLLGYTSKTMYSKISRGQLPVVSSGRPLTFSKKQLIDWMNQGRPFVAEMKANSFMDKNK